MSSSSSTKNIRLRAVPLAVHEALRHMAIQRRQSLDTLCTDILTREVMRQDGRDAVPLPGVDDATRAGAK